MKKEHFDSLGYYLFKPSMLRHSRLLVLAHGVRTAPGDIISLFAESAEKRGIAMLAPNFQPEWLRGYQTLRTAKGRWAAAKLVKRAASQQALRLGLNPKRIDLFGYSGGAQFAHRFAMWKPNSVATLTIGAAGWYTECNLELPFPQGLGCLGNDAHLGRFLAIPTLVFVGEKDTERDPLLRRSGELDSKQGLNRVERAHTWVAGFQRSASALNVLPRISLCSHKKVRHSLKDAVISGGLADLATRFACRIVPDLDRNVSRSPQTLND